MLSKGSLPKSKMQRLYKKPISIMDNTKIQNGSSVSNNFFDRPIMTSYFLKIFAMNLNKDLSILSVTLGLERVVKFQNTILNIPRTYSLFLYIMSRELIPKRPPGRSAVVLFFK